MFALAFVFALSLVVENPAPAAARTVPPRAIHTTLLLADQPALTLDVRSPRIEPSELSRVVANPALLTAMNELHLARCANLRASRPFLLGTEEFAAGDYRLGVRLAADGVLTLLVSNDENAWTIELDNSPITGPDAKGIAQVTFAFLAGADIEAFELEVRFGTRTATTALDFSLPRIIVGLNNTAHALLSRANRDARDVVKAVYLAGRASKMTSDKNPLILDTYALALFHAGQVEAAIEAQRRALSLLEPQQESHRAAMKERLSTYRTAKTN